MARLGRYIFSWLAAGAVVTAAVILLVGSEDGERNRSTVTLPPLQEISPLAAIDRAGCRLRRPPARSTLRDARAQPVPAKPGVYRVPLSSPAIAAAVRRGIIVMQYERQLPGPRLQELIALQRAVPRGGIVAPAQAWQGQAFVAFAYGRVLRCPRPSDEALDALRLFQGRYIGTGPQR